MANRHYQINEEFEVTVTFKVKLNQISNYHPLSDEQIKEQIQEAKEEMQSFIEDQVVDEYYNEDLTAGTDFCSFEISRAKEDEYIYEVLIDDEGTPFEVNSWIPIATDRIKDPSRIEEYIESGRLRKIKKEA